MNKDELELKELFESYPGLLKRQEQLQQKLLHLSGNFPLLEELVLKRLEEIEEKTKFVNHVVFESNFLNKEDECLLNYRIDGVPLEEIGKEFYSNRAAVGRRLNKIYARLAIKFTEIKI